MKNIAQKINKATESEWLSLDDYVSSGENGSTLYARYNGHIFVFDRDRKPAPADIVLYQTATDYLIAKFDEVKNQAQVLTLAARDGKTVQRSKEVIKIVGVATFKLEHLGTAL